MPDVKGLYQASAVHCVQRFHFPITCSLFSWNFFNVGEEIFLSLNCPSNEMNGYLFRSILWPGQD